MKRLLLATALVATLIVPARAVTLSDEDNAMLMAKLSIYNDKCEPLSQELSKTVDYMGKFVVSNAKLIAAASQLNSLINGYGGTAAFCQIMRPSIQQIDQKIGK